MNLNQLEILESVNNVQTMGGGGKGFFGLLVVIVIIFFILRNNNKKNRIILEQKIKENAIKNVEERKRARIEFEQELIEKRKRLMLKYKDGEIVQKILDTKIWIGMTKSMLIDSKGNPDDKKENVKKEKVSLKYYYGKRLNQKKNYSFKLEVTLENDVVTGWKDLE